MEKLPSELIILTSRLAEPITDRSIGNYLRATYRHYLKRNSLKWCEVIEGIHVQNVEWGRKRIIKY